MYKQIKINIEKVIKELSKKSATKFSSDRFFAFYAGVIALISNWKIEDRKILFFVGAPRCGTTFVGNVLNMHRDFLVSNEARVVQDVVLKNSPFKFKMAVSIFKAAFSYRLGGLEKTRYGISFDKFQSKWKNLEICQYPKKKSVKVLGDKKAGGAISSFSSNPEAFLTRVGGRPNVKFLLMMRDPIEAARSYLVSHPHEVQEFDEALERIVFLQKCGYNLKVEMPNRVLIVWYEDLISNPSDEIDRILKFCDCSADPQFKASIQRSIFKPVTATHPKGCYKVARQIISNHNMEKVYSHLSWHSALD